MYRAILIDDEPLILAGIASLIRWEDHDCCIIGKATDSHAALEMILETRPDIIITDIRMPVMDGIELIEACKEKGCLSAVIFLTNLEDFRLARQAVHLGATDYLVKLDLKPETLILALEQAKEHCSRMESHHNKELYTSLLKGSQEQLEREYFSRLLFRQPEDAPAPDPQVDARYPTAYLLLFQMRPEQIQFGQTEDNDLGFISAQIQDVVAKIASRYFSSQAILMPEKDTVLLVVSLKAGTEDKSALFEFCTKVNVALSTYFALTAHFGISQKKEGTGSLAQALAEARSALAHGYYDPSQPIVFYQKQRPPLRSSGPREFNINFLKRSMSAAVLENESQDLRAIFQELSGLFAQYKPDKTQAVSACINIYSYLHDLLRSEDSEDTDFPYSMDIAGQLSRLGSLEEILLWLDSFCEKICAMLTERKEKRSDRFVYMAKRYIHEHYQEKLTLSEIAEQLRISAGYLSTIFRRSTDQTVSDYIAQVKIEHAKELIDHGQYLIYEIADQLGFENAYYFSKVFKKVTGMAPKNYACWRRDQKK